ncbi:hypothetical protein [Tessaracoccus sp.]
MNWMLPLETLPGWPEAPAVSTPHMLMLMIGAPLAVGVIVALLAFTPALGRRFRGELAMDHSPAQVYAEVEGEARAQHEIEPRPRRGHTEIDA